MKKLTKSEQMAIALLEKAARRWPDSLWLYAAGGQLHVMRTGRGGEHVIDDHTGGVDSDFFLATINIDSDGGDW